MCAYIDIYTYKERERENREKETGRPDRETEGSWFLMTRR